MIAEVFQPLERVLALESLAPEGVELALDVRLSEEASSPAARFLSARGHGAFRRAVLSCSRSGDPIRLELSIDPSRAPIRRELANMLGAGRVVSVGPDVPPRGRVTVEHLLARHRILLSFDGGDTRLSAVVVIPRACGA
jgi:hypothetical protein